MNDTPIGIAVVGHTNTGKTSLLRTLTRDAAFGEISDRPSTTREVSRVDLLVEGRALISLHDTPGLEDPFGLMHWLEADRGAHADPVARIEAFLDGDHDGGRYEQEAKVLRQLRRSDAALVVIDAREPVLPKHREELRLLAQCGRPLMPVLNFVADAAARPAQWREDLARMGLHVLADFDTVVFDHAAERRLFEKLMLLLEARAPQLRRFVEAREQQRAELIEAGCRAIAGLLLDAAALQWRVPVDGDARQQGAQVQQRLRRAEQGCIDQLLGLFRFELGAFTPPQLPLDQGRWELDLFDPEALRVLGIRTGSAVAAGAVAGVSVDAMLGGASLGAGALIGAGAGTAWSVYQSWGRPLLDRLRGFRTLAPEETTLALLAARQLALLRALLRRGHAATQAVSAGGSVSGWPSTAVREATLRARAHPEWSVLNAGAAEARTDAALLPLVAALKDALESAERA